MVKVKEDLTGRKFGHLTVIKQVEDYIWINKKGREIHIAQWLCECDCENHTLIEVLGNQLKQKNTQSCGCWQKELAAARGSANAKYNKYDISGEYGIGWTSNTNVEFYFDISDYDKIKDYCWFELISSTGYHALVSRDKSTKKLIKMHYLIFGKYCDHINHNPLDNRTTNLRAATQQENIQNKSKQKNNTSDIIGVNFRKDRNKWRAYITVDSKQIFLGNFDNKEQAIKARLDAENIYYGEFAPQTYLFEEYGIAFMNRGEKQ